MPSPTPPPLDFAAQVAAGCAFMQALCSPEGAAFFASEEARAKAAGMVAAVDDLASRLEHYGEPPRICSDAAAALRSLARTAAMVPALRLAAGESAERFRQYADHHAAKPDPEKAERNRALAMRLERALAPFAPAAQLGGLPVITARGLPADVVFIVAPPAAPGQPPQVVRIDIPAPEAGA